MPREEFESPAPRRSDSVEQPILAYAHRTLGATVGSLPRELKNVLMPYATHLSAHRVGELFWLGPQQEAGNQVYNLDEAFSRIVIIVCGRRLAGLVGASITEDGRSRTNVLTHFLKLGVLPAGYEKVFVVFSGHRGEAMAMFSTFLTDLMGLGTDWLRLENQIALEKEARYSHENIIFAHDDVLRTFASVAGPTLWIVVSTDYHVFGTLLTHWSCDARVTSECPWADRPGSPLFPLFEKEGDRVAFLSAPNPYLNHNDPGIRCLNRLHVITFFAMPILHNLGSLMGRYAWREDEVLKNRQERGAWFSPDEKPDRFATGISLQAVAALRSMYEAMDNVLVDIGGLEKRENGAITWNTRLGNRMENVQRALGAVLNSRARRKDLLDKLSEASTCENADLEFAEENFGVIKKHVIEDIRWWADVENTEKYS